MAKLKAGELAGAERLALAEGLEYFPDEIFTLADTLEVLDLSGNNLTALPSDFYRLKHLKILFVSNNNFEVLPSVLGLCENLEMIGFKSNEIRVVPPDALPPKTRWLILTDNQISELPETIGSLRYLQKLMLAGNRLSGLPASIVRCTNLQLLRVSANSLACFPEDLFELPNLAWLAFAGNPFCSFPDKGGALPEVELGDLVLGEMLGDGASGVISRAQWRSNGFDFPDDVAVKIFKGGVTSDGFVKDELRATLVAGEHANLITPLAAIAQAGLVMRLVDASYENLAGPPSLLSCTRDVFSEGTSLSLVLVESIVDQVAAVIAHLHQNKLCHGDIYGHNMLLCAPRAHVLLGDFGAASYYGELSESIGSGLRRIEQRAFGFFIEDMLSVCRVEGENPDRVASLRARAKSSF